MTSLSLFTFTFHFHFSLSCFGEGNGNPLQYSCLENLRDGEPGRLPSVGSHRVGHDWSDLAVAAVCHWVGGRAGPVLLFVGLAAASRGYNPVAAHRLLIAVASLLEHGLR